MNEVTRAHRESSQEFVAKRCLDHPKRTKIGVTAMPRPQGVGSAIGNGRNWRTSFLREPQPTAHGLDG